MVFRFPGWQPRQPGAARLLHWLVLMWVVMALCGSLHGGVGMGVQARGVLGVIDMACME